MPAEVVGFYCRERKRWGKSILYFHTLEQCAEAHALLVAESVRADVVTGSSDREGQIQAFRAGQLDVLINCVVLAEGFDCPELKTVFCRPSCRGVTIQMCGRAFRKHPDLPFKQIVQCRQTCWPFVRTAAAALQYTWTDNGWQTLTVNPHIERVQARTLQALARIDIQLPRILVIRHSQSRRLQDLRRRNEGL